MDYAEPFNCQTHDSPFRPGYLVNETYRLERRLGWTDCTEVHSATHVRTGEQCALEILLPDHRACEARLMRKFEGQRRLPHGSPWRCHARDYVDLAVGCDAMSLAYLVLEGARHHGISCARQQPAASEALASLSCPSA